MPRPIGEVIVIVPVDTKHEGCTRVTAGFDGVAGWALIATDAPKDMHPEEFLAVTV